MDEIWQNIADACQQRKDGFITDFETWMKVREQLCLMSASDIETIIDSHRAIMSAAEALADAGIDPEAC